MNINLLITISTTAIGLLAINGCRDAGDSNTSSIVTYNGQLTVVDKEGSLLLGIIDNEDGMSVGIFDKNYPWITITSGTQRSIYTGNQNGEIETILYDLDGDGIPEKMAIVDSKKREKSIYQLNVNKTKIDTE